MQHLSTGKPPRLSVLGRGIIWVTKNYGGWVWVVSSRKMWKWQKLKTHRWDLATGKPLRLPAASSLLRRAMIWNNNAMFWGGFEWSREGKSERNWKYRSVESVKTKTTEITLLELYQPAETRHDLADADALGRRLMWVIRVMVRVWSAPSHSAYVDSSPWLELIAICDDTLMTELAI